MQDDLKLFNGIVTDLFPQINFAEQSVDYGILDAQIRKATKELGKGHVAIHCAFLICMKTIWLSDL